VLLVRKAAGDAVVLLGESLEELGGSEYLRLIHGLEAGAPPAHFRMIYYADNRWPLCLSFVLNLGQPYSLFL
jgi:hypothetical protein